MTDGDGRFTLTPVPADQHERFIAKTGYAKATAAVSAVVR
jgi:hypothetical protein